MKIIISAALITGAAVVGSLQGNEITYEAQAKVVAPVLIEEKVEWTPERVKEEIREVFPEAPELMIAVARCESSWIADAEGPTNDHGIFQIHMPSHAKRLGGIDLTDPAENIRFARKLYDESGLRPWNASRHCWNK